MHISPWMIYLWGQADSIRASLPMAIATSGLISFITLVVCFICPENSWSSSGAKKLFRTFTAGVVAFFFASILAGFLVPSSKTIGTMIVVPAIIDSKPIQKDLPEIYNSAVEAIKERIKSYKDNKENK